MTVDHKPSTPPERERIEKAGGRVGSRRGLSLPVKPNVSSLTDRVWFCTDGTKPTSVDASVSMTGLAMSRSLGDEYAHNVGVSSKPHTFYSNLSRMDEFLILASDGVWDVVGNDNAVFLVQEYIISIPSNSDWDPNEAATIVAKEARNRWENAKASSIDDITCVVVKLRKKPLEL
jgi:serine/threonine protein phosphatase PrpC